MVWLVGPLNCPAAYLGSFEAEILTTLFLVWHSVTHLLCPVDDELDLMVVVMNL